MLPFPHVFQQWCKMSSMLYSFSFTQNLEGEEVQLDLD